MNDDELADDENGMSGAEWPVDLTGVTESVVTTLGPNGRWNAAALGLFEGDPVTATTWGNTRTRRNFHRQGEGYVQFVDDPVTFAEAACSIHESDEPVLESAAAWTRVSVERTDRGTDDGTDWESWALEPLESSVERRVVPTIDRGFGAVVEATVAASRLGVDSYDQNRLRVHLEYCASVVDRAGDERDRAALEVVSEHSPWDPSDSRFDS